MLLGLLHIIVIISSFSLPFIFLQKDTVNFFIHTTKYVLHMLTEITEYVHSRNKFTKYILFLVHSR